MKKILLTFLTIFTFWSLGCAEFNESPFTDKVKTNLRDSNSKNVDKILALNLGDTFKVATISDTHSNFDSLKKVIDELNGRADIDFVMHLGDFTDRGYNYEYDTFAEAITRLRKPFLVAIGNHDSLGKGPQIFKRIFGPSDFSFDFNGTKIIVANNNRLDYLNTWSANFITQEISLSEGFPRVLLAHHVNHTSEDYFTKSQVHKIHEFLSTSPVHLVLNGHEHVFLDKRLDNYRSVQVPRVQDQQYNVLEVDKGGLHVWHCKKQNCEISTPM